jgi:hypothetical protein
MDSKRALYYAAIAIGVLIAVSVVVSIVSAILSLAWAVVSTAVTLAVLAGIVYVAYKAGSWLSGGDGGARSTDSVGGSRSASAGIDDAADRQERLRRQYVEGEIDEAEFERRIARELETEDLDDIERELERER